MFQVFLGLTPFKGITLIGNLLGYIKIFDLQKAKELISKHNLIRKINSKYTLYCSPGHFIRFNNSKIDKKLKTYLFKHQLKKSFQYSLEWEKNQLAIWDNRSMLHQATAFKGNRIMHRITVQ